MKHGKYFYLLNTKSN